MTTHYYRRAIQTLETEIGEELVALDLQKGECFGFNAIAADIWRSLETPKTFNALREELVASYDVSEHDCARDLRSLLDQLVKEGLVKMITEAS